MTIQKANIELHAHPFIKQPRRYKLTDIVKAMARNSLDIAALEWLDRSLYHFLVKEAKHLPDATFDEKGISLPYASHRGLKHRYILNAGEYTTVENLHILTVGYSFDPARWQGRPEARRLIDNGLEKGALVILDHPTVNNSHVQANAPPKTEDLVETLCLEYTGKIALEWNSYCVPWIRKVLKGVCNLTGAGIKYHDVNQKVIDISEKMWSKGINVPVVGDTDLHARRKSLLKAIGTSRVITDVEGECATDIVASMKKNIFNAAYRNSKQYGNYQNQLKYVSGYHLARAFGLPLLLRRPKPRA